jgi:hypothetical protein
MLVAEVDDAKLRRKMQLVLAILLLVAMPIVIGGVAAVLWLFAAPSLNPGVRWQVVQIVQIVHVLWPPFLVYFYLWKKQRAQAIDAASNLIVLAEAA